MANRTVICIFFIILTFKWYSAKAVERNTQEGHPGFLFLQILLVDSLDEAESVAIRLRDGESFDELARIHCSKGLRERAGYLGRIEERSLPPVIRKALSGLDPGSTSDRIRIGTSFAFFRLLTPEQAASYEAASGSAEYYVDLGLILGELSDERAEIRAYEKAIELDPERVEAHINLGEVLRRKALRILKEENGSQTQSDDELHPSVELLDRAIEHFKLALELDPVSAEAHYNLGLTYAAEGMYGLAVLEFKEVLRFRPEDSEIQKSMAAALYLNGDYEQAWVHAQKARDMGVDVTLLADKIKEALDREAAIKK